MCVSSLGIEFCNYVLEFICIKVKIIVFLGEI
jgi:hypothetical protein